MEGPERIVEEAIGELRPSEEERLEALRIFEEVKGVVESSLRIPYDFTVELHGSVAKGTELRGAVDLDVFLLVRYEGISREWLEREVVRPLFGVLKGLYRGTKLKYATHPYIHIDLGRYEVDVVPAYWARDVSEARTAVDRTPFHTRYVLSRLAEKGRDEVRLLKAFFKSIGVYGAEIKVEGFSGYLTELLVIKYGSFLDALRSIARWRFGEVVVVEGGSVEAVSEHPRGLSRVPLTVPDPVDPRRNAASAVCAESLARAVLASTVFLQRPSREMLLSGTGTPRPGDVESSRRLVVESGREAVGMLFRLSGEVVPDVLWGRLRSIAKSLMSSLERAGFTVVSYSMWSDELSEAVILATVLPRELPPFEVHAGPPLGRTDDIESFVSKYYSGRESLGPYVSPAGRIFTLRRRRHARPHQVLEAYAESLERGEGVSVSGVLKNLDEVCEYVRSRGAPELLAAFRRMAALELV